MTYTIAEPCIDVKDKACVEECPVDCIYEGPRMLYIHPEECIDCEFFEDDHSGLGSPGGAAGVGAADVDHATIASWE